MVNLTMDEKILQLYHQPMIDYLKMGEEYERLFFETVEQIREKREREEGSGEWSQAAVARRAFPSISESSAKSKYTRMKKVVERTGSPQHVTLAESYALVRAIRYEWIDFVRKVDDLYEQQRKKRGNPRKNVA
jgi:hypothetical protein